MSCSKLQWMGCLLLVTCLGIVLAGCASTVQKGGAEPSGFLGDYSQLKEGTDDEAQLIYINPETDFAAYDKVIIEPITIWADEDSDVADLPEEDRQMLMDYLFKAAKDNLEGDYAIVDKPGPGVMVLKVAIIDAEGSMVVLDTLTSLYPGTHVLSYGMKLITGTHTFVGEAGVEAEIVDSQTGERLIAAVDERAGNKVPDFSGTWGDVKDAYDYWAGRLKERLAKLRTGDNTPL